MKGHTRFHKGSWNVVIFQGRRINSKGKLADSYRWITGFDTQKKAQEELTRQLAARLEGSYVEPHKMSLAHYLRHWLTVVEQSLAPTTFQRYQKICEKNIIPALGQFRLTKLTAVDVEGFDPTMLRRGRKSGQSGLSGTSVLHFHRVLHKALKDAAKKQIISHNVADAVQVPRKNHKEMEAPTEDVMAALLAQVRDDPRVYLPTVIACGSGLRRGEILGLRWSDLNPITSTVRISRSLCQIQDSLLFKDVKQRKSRRTIVLPSFVMSALTEARREQATNRKTFGADYRAGNLICCLPDGSPIPPDTVSQVFRRYSRALGLTTRFHDLRHGHASQALQNGVPVKTVQSRLGHSTAAFTLDVYGHLLPGADEHAADVIQNRLGSAIEKYAQQQVN